MTFSIQPELFDDYSNSGLAYSDAFLSEIFSKASGGIALTHNEISFLLSINTPAGKEKLFDAANKIKEKFKGKKIRVFAPLYISNECVNSCVYCGFRLENKDARRLTLSVSQIIDEIQFLTAEGHRHILLVTGENDKKVSVAFLKDLLSEIRNKISCPITININYPPVSQEDFNVLSGIPVSGYQSFQETYHPDAYKNLHPKGPKADFNWRINTFERAGKAGIKYFGAGVLFGLYDYKFEVQAIISHMYYLINKFGIEGTLSVPRLRPSENSMLKTPPSPVSEEELKTIIAIYRLALPAWDISISTRETEKFREEALHIGGSMISAGSKTNPGGYLNKNNVTKQFELEDIRPLNEVITSLQTHNLIPCMT